MVEGNDVIQIWFQQLGTKTYLVRCCSILEEIVSSETGRSLLLTLNLVDMFILLLVDVTERRLWVFDPHHSVLPTIR